MGPVARGLAHRFRVLEPFQRGSGHEPLSVARHVADLKALVDGRCGGAKPALVGHSWGAMLALAYAGAHPGDVGALVLVGCGTFDRVSRDRMRKALDARLDDGLRERLRRLPDEVADADERFRAMGELLLPAYSYDLVSFDPEIVACDARAHEETWDDMVRLQEAGVYPAAFRAITSPVLMLHGAADPHPGPMIRDALRAHLPHLEYREWARCGHYPWLERAAREEFFACLSEWLGRRAAVSRVSPAAGSPRQDVS